MKTKEIKRIKLTAFDLTKIIAVMFLTIILMTSCNKDSYENEPEPQKQEIIQQSFKLSGFEKINMGTKGWDPRTWVYNYNPNPFTITFENLDNPQESITRTVTVQELINGIQLSMFSGRYNIKYQTIHNSTTEVDISINMSNISITGTPVKLMAQYEDFLIVFDIPVDELTIVGGGGTVIQTFNTLGDIKYIYFNKTTDPIQGDLRIKYLPIGAVQYQYRSMLDFIFGSVFWFTSPFSAGTTIEFPQWVVNKIVL